MPVDKPSGRSAPGAVPLLIAICAGAGLAVGVGMGLVAHWLFSLFILFPAVIGLLVGGAAGGQIGVGRMRAPVLVGVIAFGGGAVGQLGTHGVDYVMFRRTVAAAMAEDPTAAGFTVDDALEAETGRRGLIGYLTMAAEEGVTIGRVGSSNDPFFSGWGVWGLWGAEVLVAAGIAAWMAATAARDPFCETCDAWYERDVVIAVGAPEKVAWAPLLGAAEAGEWGPALARMGAPTPSGSSVVHLLGCTSCRAHRPILLLKVATLDGGKVSEKEQARVQIAPERAEALILAVGERGAAQQAQAPV